MKCAIELPVSTWIKLIKCYIGKATEGFSKSLKIWNPTPYCLQDIYTYGKNKKHRHSYDKYKIWDTAYF